eukprot:6462508-Amphidinium_carterae.2
MTASMAQMNQLLASLAGGAPQLPKVASQDPVPAEFVELNTATGERLGYRGPELAARERQELAHSGGILQLERLPWQPTLEVLKDARWNWVSPEQNLCFWRCMSKALEEEGIQQMPGDLKEQVLDRAMLAADKISSCVGAPLEVVRKELRESAVRGALANEKAIIAAAVELKRCVVVCDPSSRSVWAFVPEGLAEPGLNNAICLWLHKSHFWVAPGRYRMSLLPSLALTESHVPSLHGGGAPCTLMRTLATVSAVMGGLSEGLGDWSTCNWSRPMHSARENVRIVTCNSTSWTSAQAQIEAWMSAEWRPHVILLQEHHLQAARCEGATAWCHGQGYLSHFSPAVVTDKAGTSGGTAVLWKSQFEATPLPTPAGLEGRFTGVRLTGCYKARCLIGSVYLQVGQSRERLMQQLSALDTVLHKGEELVFIGGDWNYARRSLCELGWAQRMDLQLVGIGVPTVKQEIDFFAVDAMLVHKLRYVQRAPFPLTSPHPALALELVSASSDDRHYEVVRAPRLPVQRPLAPQHFVREPGSLLRNCSEGDLEEGWHTWSQEAAVWIHKAWQPEAGPPRASSLRRSRGLRQKLCTLHARLKARRVARSSKTTLMWMQLNRWLHNPERVVAIGEWAQELQTWEWQGETWTVHRVVQNVSWSQPFLQWLEVKQMCEMQLYNAESTDRRRRNQQWRKFVAESLTTGGKGIYRFLRGPLQIATVRLDDEGWPLARPQAAAQEAETWWKLWDRHQTYDQPDERVMLALRKEEPAILVEEVEAALRGSPPKAPGLDGWVLASWNLLPSAFIQSLVVILNRWMSELRVDHMWPTGFALIPKTLCASRPIALTQAPMRLWSRVMMRRYRLRELALIRSFHGGVKGANCEAVASLHSLLKESARHRRQHSLMVYLDLAKCYEHVRHSALMTTAMELGFGSVAAHAIRLYSTLRVVMWRGTHTVARQCQGSIFAGCSLAVCLLRVHLWSMLNRAQQVSPHAFVSNVVDDTSTVSRGGLSEVCDATGAVLGVLREELSWRGLPINEDKTAVLASARVVEEQFALQHGIHSLMTRRTKFLGVGRVADHKRRVWIQRDRLRVSGKRLARARGLWRGGLRGKQLAAVVNAGVHSSALYGLSEKGMAPGPLLCRVRRATRLLTKVTRKSSAILASVMNPQAWQANFAVGLHQRAVSVWAQLVKHPCVREGDLLAALGGAAKKAIQAKSPWHTATGPAAALLLQAVRLGWKMLAQGDIEVQGHVFRVASAGATALNRMVRKSTAAWLLVVGTGGKRVLGPAVHLVRRLLAGLEPLHAAILQLVVTGGTWTADLLYKRGLCTSPECLWCGRHGDFRHRVEECAAYSVERGLVTDLGWAEWHAMQLDGDADVDKLLPSATRFERQEVSGSECARHVVLASGVAQVLCTDGSAIRPTCAVTRRAAWSYVAYSAQGVLLAYGFGLVPNAPGGAQSVFEGELYAVWQALGRIRHRSRDLVLVIDNQAVVSGLVSLQLGLRPKSTMMEWWDHINGMDIMAVSVRKIASHQRGPSKDCHWLHWVGNHLADKLAEQAFGCWPDIAEADRALEGRVQGIQQLWHFAIKVGLAQMQGKWDCPEVPKGERSGRKKRQTGSRRGPARACSWPPWVAELLATAESEVPDFGELAVQRRPDRSPSAVVRGPERACKEAAIGPGHTIWQMCFVESGRSCGLVCSECGAYGTSVWRHLVRACPGRIPTRQAQRTRVAKGLHPQHGRGCIVLESMADHRDSAVSISGDARTLPETGF